MKSPKLVVGALALALTLLIVAAAFAASTNFVEPNSSPVAAGDGPVAIAATDLDADGDADLAVADQGTGTTPGVVTILKNRGSGSFFQPTSSPTPAGLLPAGIAAADFDGDSDPDLAVPNFAGDDVTIQKNNGNGGFFVPASSPEPAGDAPDGIVAADFDGDDDMDLAVVNTSSGNVSILVNNGTGNFAPAASSPIPAGTNPRDVLVVDIDGDLDPDLAVPNQGSNDVTILKNVGGNQFHEPATSPESVGQQPFSGTVADLDGDGDQDLGITNSMDSTLTVLRNNGAGNFTEPATSPESTGIVPEQPAAADFDLDGDQDLAVANAFTNNVTVLRNAGHANFAEPPTSPEPVGTFPGGMTAADLDGDGDSDLAVGNVNSDNVTILRNR